MPPNPPSNAHGFAMRSMLLRDMQIPKSEKKISWPPPPPKSWGRPCLLPPPAGAHGHSACCISPSHQCSNIPSCCMSIYYNLVILKLNNNPLIVLCTLVNHYVDNLVSRATCTKTCVGVVSRHAGDIYHKTLLYNLMYAVMYVGLHVFIPWNVL